MLSVSEAYDTCRNTGAARVQEETVSKLMVAADSYAALIRDVHMCPASARTPQLIMNTSSSILDTIATVSAGFGLTGLISGFLSKIIGAVIDSNAMKGSPKMGARQLEDEIKFENLACVWYQVQNRNLNCQEHQEEKSKSDSIKRPFCSKYLDALGLSDNLVNLKNLIAKFNQIGKSEDENDSLDQMNSLLNKNIAHPSEGIEKSITVKAHMTDVSAELLKSKNLKDKDSGGKLKSLLDAMDELSTLTAQTANISEEELGKIKAKFKKSLTKFNVDDAIDRYWKLKKADFTPSAMFLLDPSMSAYNALKSLGVTYDGNISKINLATNLMVKHFRDPFIARLKLTNERYQDSIRQGDPKATLSHAVQLTNLCTLVAGMYYAENKSDDGVLKANSLREIPDSVPRDYENLCKPISCIVVNKKPILFSSHESEIKRADDFKTHTCQMQLDYDIVIKAVSENLKEGKAVCK